MKKVISFPLISIIFMNTAILYAIPTVEAQISKDITDVPLIAQETDNSCWAAASQMVLSYYGWYGPEVSQIQIAREVGNEDYYQTGMPIWELLPIIGDWDEALERLGKVDIDPEWTISEGGLSFDEVIADINLNRPIIALTTIGGGHTVVITGYVDNPGETEDYVIFNDPAPPEKRSLRWEDFQKLLVTHPLVIFPYPQALRTKPQIEKSEISIHYMEARSSGILRFTVTSPSRWAWWTYVRKWDVTEKTWVSVQIVDEIWRETATVDVDITINGSGNYRLRIHSTMEPFERTTWDVQIKLIPDDAIKAGLKWLRDRQNPDGSWTYHGPRFSAPNVGLTGLAALAFINYGYTESDPTVSKAINYILSNVKTDGSIWSHYQIYDTSMAVIALLANRDIREKYKAKIEDAKNFLISAQNVEPAYSSADKFYGGWPYYKGQYWADLSNTQFVLLALYEAKKAGFTVPAETFDKAKIFVTRCQNLKATNPNFSFYDDGGFIYQPASGIWAGGRSYGSMTAAGIWSLHCSGVTSTDVRIQKGLEWLATNYYVDQNYPIGNTWLYYYLFSVSKAYFLTGTTMIGGHDWYADISNFLVERQAADGRWPSVFWEEPDELTTVEAILALETKAPPAVSRSMTFKVDSPADLHVFDPLERHVGIDYTTWTVELEIPGATYSGPGTEPQTITIPDPMAGTYKVKLVGRAIGPYTLTIEGAVDNVTVYSENYSGTISPGYIYYSDVTVSTIVGPLTIWSTEPELVPPEIELNTWITNSNFENIENFRIVFTPDKKTDLYVLTATNPGQFYFNILVNNIGGSPTDVTITYAIDENFFLKGARPIHVYSDLARTIDITENCAFSDNTIIVENVAPGAMVYVTIHLDYVLKGTRWMKSQAEAWYSEHTFSATANGIPSSITIIGKGKS